MADESGNVRSPTPARQHEWRAPRGLSGVSWGSVCFNCGERLGQGDSRECAATWAKEKADD